MKNPKKYEMKVQEALNLVMSKAETLLREELKDFDLSTLYFKGRLQFGTWTLEASGNDDGPTPHDEERARRSGIDLSLHDVQDSVDLERRFAEKALKEKHLSSAPRAGA